jgi:hypothetical protein
MHGQGPTNIKDKLCQPCQEHPLIHEKGTHCPTHLLSY